MVKWILFRVVIVYVVFSHLRRPPPPQQPTDPKAAAGPSVASSNLFPKDTPLELYAYLSENEPVHFTFRSTDDERGGGGEDPRLFWHIPEFVYGDWTGGPHGDGSFTKEGFVDTEQVCVDVILLLPLTCVCVGGEVQRKDCIMGFGDGQW